VALAREALFLCGRHDGPVLEQDGGGVVVVAREAEYVWGYLGGEGHDLFQFRPDSRMIAKRPKMLQQVTPIDS
jgi:hypothetical protein